MNPRIASPIPVSKTTEAIRMRNPTQKRNRPARA
jgi:hypothetical protein